MKDTIILIGGAPCTGKSTLAANLAKRFGLPWISTDQIRSIMQTIATDRDNHPDLFNSSDISAEEYYNARTIDQIVEDENNQSREVQKGIISLMRENYNWESFIIEGIAITPDFVDRLSKEFQDTCDFKPLFVIDENRDRIRESIFSRGLWDDPQNYPDSFKEIEVEWVVAYNVWIKQELKKYPYPSVLVSDRKTLDFEVVQLFQNN
jgi:2-phosphoglycerate kinase